MRINEPMPRGREEADSARATPAPAERAAMRPHAVLALQRTAGNAAVAHLMQSVQRKKGDATDEVIEHIFKGEVKDKKVKGFHSENEAGAAVARIKKGSAKKIDPSGVYWAEEIESKADASHTKPGGSSFYPSGWNRATVKDVIEKSSVTSRGGVNRAAVGPGGVEIGLKIAGDTIYPVQGYGVEEEEEEGGRGRGRGGKKKGR